MEEYGRRLLADICAWKNMEEGCWLRCVHEGIWQKVVGRAMCMEEYGRRLLAEMCSLQNMVEGCSLSYMHVKKIAG